ncbi:hypothetical protein [Frigoribacterium sp. PvP032]|uniref:hypothetical protein n=1 Tax=Frigoribacterium sp. PvP032 TaxID=2806589 RepID=UPI001AEB6C0E|nr:hypothetical protein [Frigoribacterium sp. PvP032]MBP1190417.1 hypothetical protein [Frigoribacterium sp. PvP032]
MRLPSPLPVPFDERPFSVSEALRAGITPDRLRASDLVIPHRGTRALSEPDGLRARAEALAPLLAPDEFFSHTTALALWGLPLPARWEDGPLHVAGTTSRQRRRRGVIGHRLLPGTPRWTAGSLMVASPVEAWIESAAMLGLDEIVQLGDSLAGSWSTDPRARGIALDVLVDASIAARRRPGQTRVSQASMLVRERVDSPQETRLRLLIVRAGLREPEVNVKRRTADGLYLGKPDLSWMVEKAAVDFEGDGHRTDRTQWQRDIDRRERFVDDGWSYHRVTDRHLQHPLSGQLLARLRRSLER